MSPRELSKQLREDQSPLMKSRRLIVGLSVLGVGLGQAVTLYQTGILKHLPDPPIPVFDSDKVDASDYAYKRLGTPDAILMMLTYASTAWLAAANGKDRHKTTPWLPILMFGKVVLDVATNLKLAQEEWGENKKLCFYCQTASLTSIISLFLAWPEAKAAWKNK